MGITEVKASGNQVKPDQAIKFRLPRLHAAQKQVNQNGQFGVSDDPTTLEASSLP